MRIFSQTTNQHVFAIINKNDGLGPFSIGFASACSVYEPASELARAAAVTLEIPVHTCENVVSAVWGNPELDGFGWLSPSDFRALKDLAHHVRAYHQYLADVHGSAPSRSTFIVNLNTGRSMTFSTFL